MLSGSGSSGVLAALCLFSMVVRADDSLAPVRLDLFYESGCTECARVRSEVLPELSARYGGLYAMTEHDLSEADEVALLVALQERVASSGNRPVSLFVDYSQGLFGFANIRDGLFGAMDRAIEARMSTGWTLPRKPVQQGRAGTMALLRKRARAFTLPAVLLGGLVDGVNPCAISALVFLMSLLSVSKVRGGRLLLAGGSYAAATFVTYTALGLGLLGGFHSLPAFGLMSVTVNIALGGILGVLAGLSFSDALAYRRTRDAGRIRLQLPARLKRAMHAVMRRGLRAHSLVAGVAAVAVAATLLESVCTGQIYVPVLVALVREGEINARTVSLLLLYNVMFLVPLVVVFILVYRGLTTERLLSWSRRHVVAGKALMGLFLLLLAILVIWL